MYPKIPYVGLLTLLDVLFIGTPKSLQRDKAECIKQNRFKSDVLRFLPLIRFRSYVVYRRWVPFLCIRVDNKPDDDKPLSYRFRIGKTSGTIRTHNQ